MEVTLVGLVCFAACVFVVAQPLRWGLIALGLFLPLRAAAAVNLPAAGDLSILCSQIVIVALAAGLMLRPKVGADLLRFSMQNPAILTLSVFVLYAVLTSFFMPRLFSGSALVYSLERDATGLSALNPTSGNITQPLYLASQLVLFAILTYAFASRGGLAKAGTLVNVATAVHLLFAAINLTPGGEVVLQHVWTANYAIHSTHEIAGMRRLIGSYSEASAFGAMSAVLFAYNFVRFIQTRGLWFLAASVLTLACLALSLATTSFAVLVLLGIVWALHAVWRLVSHGLAREHVLSILFCALAALLLSAAFFFEAPRELAGQVYERLFGTKLSSDSGVERGAWNMQAIRNAVDTMGFGVGLGSARTSSLATALLSNTGIFGSLIYAAFLVFAFLRPWRHALGSPQDREAIVARRMFAAGRAGALAGLFAALISGTTVDQGSFFLTMAAVASGALASRRSRAGGLVGQGSMRGLFPALQPLGEFPQIGSSEPGASQA